MRGARIADRLLGAALWLAAAVLPAAALEPPRAATVAARITQVDSVPQAPPHWHQVQGLDTAAWADLYQTLHTAMAALPRGARVALAYRIDFDAAPAAPAQAWALYLPQMPMGVRLSLNGTTFADLPASDATHHVRWMGPGLLTLPQNLWLPRHNQLLLEMERLAADGPADLAVPLAGPLRDMVPLYERRRFWAKTMPQITVVVCLVAALAFGFVWWRRRSELLYGLFGLAALLWSIRTAVFVIEVLPLPWWYAWRVSYYAATGGFIALLAVFALRLSGHVMPRLERAFLGYALLGPVLLLATAGGLDQFVARVWIGGLIPIGLAVVAFSALAAWRQRTGPAVALFAAMLLTALAGVHDYLVDQHAAFALPLALRHWLVQGIFLMHHGANLLLLVMAAILGLRHIEALETEARLHRELEARVARRDEELRQRHARVAALEREQVVAEERQRIMRDLHDGLGSRMFTTLQRVERGTQGPVQVARMLRDCIADMRLIFDVAAPDQPRFADIMGDLRYRWEPVLRESQVASEWLFEALDEAPNLSALVTLQVLRIVQEALSNALRHAAAAHVRVQARIAAGVLELRVQDDGIGFDVQRQDHGRGLANMRNRAARVGAALAIATQPGATAVSLRLPLAAASP